MLLLEGRYLLGFNWQSYHSNHNSTTMRFSDSRHALFRLQPRWVLCCSSLGGRHLSPRAVSGSTKILKADVIHFLYMIRLQTRILCLRYVLALPGLVTPRLVRYWSTRLWIDRLSERTENSAAQREAHTLDRRVAYCRYDTRLSHVPFHTLRTLVLAVTGNLLNRRATFDRNLQLTLRHTAR